MSKIDFRLGNLTGRLAGMVGASWKGIDYVRKMVIPANPNTSAQQQTRVAFAKLVQFGRRINSTILKDYILPTPKKMSPFNKYIQRNKDVIDAGFVDWKGIMIGDGSLYPIQSVVFSVDDATNKAAFSWGTIAKGEGLATDIVLAVAYNEDQDEYAFGLGETRADGATGYDLDLEQVAGDKITGWLFCVQLPNLSSTTTSSDEISA